MELAKVSFAKLRTLNFMLPMTLEPRLVKIIRDKFWHNNKAAKFCSTQPESE